MGTGFSSLEIVQGPEVCERSAEKVRLENTANSLLTNVFKRRTPL